MSEDLIFLWQQRQTASSCLPTQEMSFIAMCSGCTQLIFSLSNATSSAMLPATEKLQEWCIFFSHIKQNKKIATLCCQTGTCFLKINLSLFFNSISFTSHMHTDTVHSAQFRLLCVFSSTLTN